jgi:cytochrome c oxidase subunit 4
MSAHYSNHDLQHLYEGDQSKLYSGALSHHSDINSKESKDQVKRIWKVTGILTVVTIVEVLLGLLGHGFQPFSVIIAIFLILTIFKAFYIVKVFMHLGDEKKNFVYFVLVPLLLFFWMIIAFLVDGQHWLNMNFTFANTIKDIFS